MRLPSLIHRVIELFLLVTLLTACSTTDNATPSPTLTSILPMPTHTATSTPSPTDTPTATPTPTKKTSVLTLVKPWNSETRMDKSSYPLFNMNENGAALIDELVAMLQYNENDTSSTLNGEVLFAADAPKAVVMEVMPGQYIIRPARQADGISYKILYAFFVDDANGASVPGIGEYRAVIAINLDGQKPVILNCLLAINTNDFKRMTFDFVIPDAEQGILEVSVTSPSGEFANNLRFSPFRQDFSPAAVGWDVVPGHEAFINALKQNILLQVSHSTGISVSSTR